MKKLFYQLIIFFFLIIPVSFAQNNNVDNEESKKKVYIKNDFKSFPVLFKGETLFIIYTGTDLLTPQDRAQIIQKRLENIAQNYKIDIKDIKLKRENSNIEIIVDNNILMTVNNLDAKVNNISQQELAHNYKEEIKKSLKKIRSHFIVESLISGLLFTLLATLILITLIRLINFTFPKINQKINDIKEKNIIPTIKIQNFEIINLENIILFINKILALTKNILVLLLLYIYIPLVLNFFPWTKGFSDTLFDYVTVPIRNIFISIIEFIPDLLNIVIILFITYYFTKFVRIFFNAVKNKTINISGFHEDWIDTTYKMVRFLILSFAAIMIFPYLPGSKSPAFQGVSVFIGILLSFGSSSAISNIVAGIVLTYTSSFKIGDRIKIGDTTGDVIEKNLLVTRIRTIKNVDITIPNSSVLSSHIINYSSNSKKEGLILNTTITIGYDVPWRKVHEVLIDCALCTDNIMKEPKPFVLQTALNDFYVSYEINAYTREANSMARTYSELYKNIQDKFNEAGIEIMSPHYSAVRDGNLTTIPEKYLSDDYEIPSFRIKNTNDKIN